MRSNYIYLLQEREFIKTKENIYKVGMTQKENLCRFNQYPKGSILLFQMICRDGRSVEKKVLVQFNKLFILKEEIGCEYFEGDFNLMIDVIYAEIQKDNNEEKTTGTIEPEPVETKKTETEATKEAEELIETPVELVEVEPVGQTAQTISSTDHTTKSCKRCGYTCKNWYELVNHLERKFSCQPLLQNITTQELIEEYKTQENQRKPVDCETRGRTFSNYKNKWRHQNTICSKKSKVASDTMNDCKRCGFSTPKRYKLLKHLERKFTCQPILSDIPVQKLIEEYKIVERENKPLKCHSCDSYFSCTQSRCVHKKTVCGALSKIADATL